MPARWRQWPAWLPAACRAVPPPLGQATPPFFTGWLRGLIAVLLLWYSPAMLISTRGWPIWDQWVVPFYLLAILFASLDWWFVSGVALGIGVLFKGQQTFVAAVFLLWPLFVNASDHPKLFGAGGGGVGHTQLFGCGAAQPGFFGDIGNRPRRGGDRWLGRRPGGDYHGRFSAVIAWNDRIWFRGHGHYFALAGARRPPADQLLAGP